ncbi:MAG: glycosyltransferase [Desulfosalsimonadaceae bacterium]
MPKISVVIPAYNRAWALGRAFDSVLAQDFPDFELLVVDDGSDDDTRALLEAYGSRLTWIAQSNQGVSAARNRGVARAAGDLVAFLDSDDYWYPQKLRVQAAFFDARPDARICQTQEIWIRNGRRVNPGRRHAKPAGDIFVPSLSLCLVSPSAVMLKKSLFEEMGGFDEALPACEDYDLWLRVSARYPVHLIDRPLVVKTGGHSDQLSGQPGLDRYRIASLEKLLCRGGLSPKQQRAAEAVLAEKCAIYAKGCKKRGRIGEASYYRNLAGSYAKAGGDSGS